MRVRRMKNDRGITLIALVITIIVLLILAGVSLSLIIGENGITERAIKAGKIYDVAGAKEQVQALVADYESQYYEEKYTRGNDVSDKIGDYVAEKLVAETKISDYDLMTDKDKKAIILQKDGTRMLGIIKDDASIEWGEENASTGWTQYRTIVTNGDVILEVGSTVSGYNVAVPNSGSWCVLGAEDGKLLITTNKNVKTVEMSPRESYQNRCINFK